MKTLADFTPLEAAWFFGDFARGQRHLKTKELQDYFFSYSSVFMHTPEDLAGPEEFKHFAYAVASPPTETSVIFSGVMKNPVVSGGGIVKDPEGNESYITYLSESLTEELREVFGPEAFAIAVMTFQGTLDAVVFYGGEIPLESAKSLDEAFSLVFQAGITFLFPRLHPQDAS